MLPSSYKPLLVWVTWLPSEDRPKCFVAPKAQQKLVLLAKVFRYGWGPLLQSAVIWDPPTYRRGWGQCQELNFWVWLNCLFEEYLCGWRGRVHCSLLSCPSKSSAKGQGMMPWSYMRCLSGLRKAIAKCLRPLLNAGRYLYPACLTSYFRWGWESYVKFWMIFMGLISHSAPGVPLVLHSGL